MWVVQVQNDLVGLSEHYIHEIDELVSLDKAECFELEKKKKKKARENGYIVVLKSLVYEPSISVVFTCTK